MDMGLRRTLCCALENATDVKGKQLRKKPAGLHKLVFTKRNVAAPTKAVSYLNNPEGGLQTMQAQTGVLHKCGRPACRNVFIRVENQHRAPSPSSSSSSLSLSMRRLEVQLTNQGHLFTLMSGHVFQGYTFRQALQCGVFLESIDACGITTGKVNHQEIALAAFFAFH
jgi:hypothetical protein